MLELPQLVVFSATDREDTLINVNKMTAKDAMVIPTSAIARLQHNVKMHLAKALGIVAFVVTAVNALPAKPLRDDQDSAYIIQYKRDDQDSAYIIQYKNKREEKRDDQDSAYIIQYKDKREDAKRDDQDSAYIIQYKNKREDAKRDDQDSAYIIQYKDKRADEDDAY
ncbi:hypothetical protein G7Y89_g1075 [Cudoniella acicularis]|uniref:Uncharacterized protein n=1 Tax=Cudoniella acicularis TaxID=354080 RepID=A0A8H4RYU9_9HELO|nr:hypothetical protein G7Y89_g1075 [Cudoniella acicularis]